ncbi:hypothetical protein N0B51_05460 [Tsuneonella sp. YG55]|uniref:Uncharacterized protein n=1 Tax=Tsuneonella litorea TaxID=2976475 RepID=A0A9X3AKV9_9SPHN|nr:hypothetical protein [Tsuneonella litorea]MCT2558423.1 hypothetical protein [Tsuneonella litorea]
MDTRVEALIQGLKSAETIDPLEARKRIVDLFNEINDEEGRTALLASLDAVIGLAIRYQETCGNDSQALRNALLADKRALVLAEAMGANELVEPAEMLRILEREIAAGRMERDDFYQLARDGSDVLESPSPKPKPGFLKRLFG